jgi:hypothetical protein
VAIVPLFSKIVRQRRKTERIAAIQMRCVLVAIVLQVLVHAQYVSGDCDDGYTCVGVTSNGESCISHEVCASQWLL